MFPSQAERAATDSSTSLSSISAKKEELHDARDFEPRFEPIHRSFSQRTRRFADIEGAD